jgi:hypothetical protein
MLVKNSFLFNFCLLLTTIFLIGIAETVFLESSVGALLVTDTSNDDCYRVLELLKCPVCLKRNSFYGSIELFIELQADWSRLVTFIRNVLFPGDENVSSLNEGLVKKRYAFTFGF